MSFINPSRVPDTSAKLPEPSLFSSSATNYTFYHPLGSEVVPDPRGHVNCFVFILSPCSTMNHDPLQNL